MLQLAHAQICMCVTKQLGSNGTAFNRYYGGAPFESRPEQLLFWPSNLVTFIQPLYASTGIVPQIRL
jgi:hypothetical protein